MPKLGETFFQPKRQSMEDLPTADNFIDWMLNWPVQKKEGYSVITPNLKQREQDMMDAALGFLGAGVTAFHGSPHKFTQFSSKHIGTGEGAQAYGHGLYFAESPGTAKYYMDVLSDGATYSVKGRALSVAQQNTYTGDAAIWISRQKNKIGFEKAKKQMLDSFNSKMEYARSSPQKFPERYRKQLEEAISEVNSWTPNDVEVIAGGHLYEVDIPDEAISKMLDWDKPLSEQSESVRSILKEAGLYSDLPHQIEIANLKNLVSPDKFSSNLKVYGTAVKERYSTNRGFIEGPKFVLKDGKITKKTDGYRIFVRDADVQGQGRAFKTMSDAVEALNKTMIEENILEKSTGEMLYKELARRAGETMPAERLRGAPYSINQEEASKYLNSLGIPGIKYLDAGSRSAGKGTRNFVVFDDSIIKMKK